MQEILQVNGLSKRFGGLDVLKDISFSIQPEEKIALIGPNGAGKTTLFNVIGGQLSATSGQILLADTDITGMSPDRRLHLGLARSYQTNNLFFKLTVLDNILLALYGAEKRHVRLFRSLKKRADLTDAAQALLEPLELWDSRFELTASLSYGDQRLVETACAFASRPQMVVLDEPSAGLPTAEAFVFAGKIRQLLGSATLLFCAHDMDLVFNLADKIMVLYYGTLIAEGTPEEIKDNPKVQEIYLGSEEGGLC